MPKRALYFCIVYIFGTFVFLYFVYLVSLYVDHARKRKIPDAPRIRPRRRKKPNCDRWCTGCQCHHHWHQQCHHQHLHCPQQCYHQKKVKRSCGALNSKVFSHEIFSFMEYFPSWNISWDSNSFAQSIDIHRYLHKALIFMAIASGNTSNVHILSLKLAFL